MLAGLAVAAITLVAAVEELRAALLFAAVPGYAKRQYLRRLDGPEGQQVWLLGTIHTAHLHTPQYPLWDLTAVLDHLQPDTVLVEGRAGQWAAGNLCDGPIEMGMVALAARNAGVAVHGMDWWQQPDTPAVRRSNEQREDQMYRRIRPHLVPERILVVTGFSHVTEFVTRLMADGHQTTTPDDAQLAAAFEHPEPPTGFPVGMTACLQRRIAEDSAALDAESNADWRTHLGSALAVRQRFLQQVRSVGER